MKPNTDQVQSATAPGTQLRTPPASRLTAHLVEEGTAFAELNRRGGMAAGAATGRGGSHEVERFEVIVIGAGQAGLSTGYHLARHGIRFVILDAHPRIGDSWRSRWDSLRLFTPARLDGLDGMPFPAPGDAFPTKDEMAEYLEAYAAAFRLPVRTGVRADRLSREGDRYVVTAGGKRFEADHVVVATASYREPRVPAFSSELDPSIVQLHSADYRRPSQLPGGRILAVGAGNSGAEIAIELARRGHPVCLSGRDTGAIPFRIESLLGRRVLGPLVLRGAFHRLLTLDTPLGRRVRPTFISQGGPLIRTRSGDLAAAGVERVPRTVGVRDGMPLLADGRVLEVAGVVWCTGFHSGFSWIDLPVFDEDGEPVQYRGRVTGEPGLYFVGLHFLYAVSSTMVHGVGRDARHVADTIAARTRRARAV